MRLRLAELLEEKGVSAYSVVKASDGRISLSTIYRLKGLHGRVKSFDADVCQALCDVLGITPAELFESEPGDGAAGAKPATKRRAG